MDDVLLTATDPYQYGALPFDVKGAGVVACDVAGITSIAPFKGQHDAASSELYRACGLALSEPGTMATGESHRITWSQWNQWFLFGPVLDLHSAATADQTDGWSGLCLTGPRANEVLARLTPIDLRDLTAGRVVRTECAHRMALIIALEDGYEIWVMRSLARDFLRHLKEALDSVAAISSKIAV